MATEKRLIDVSNENVKAVLEKYPYYPDGIWKFMSMTGKFPTVYAVEVVRCKDCRWAREKDHREPTDTPRELICQCFKHHYIPAPWGARMAVSPDDFCSYGERKTDG